MWARPRITYFSIHTFKVTGKFTRVKIVSTCTLWASILNYHICPYLYVYLYNPWIYPEWVVGIVFIYEKTVYIRLVMTRKLDNITNFRKLFSMCISLRIIYLLPHKLSKSFRYCINYRIHSNLKTIYHINRHMHRNNKKNKKKENNKSIKNKLFPNEFILVLFYFWFWSTLRYEKVKYDV